MHETSTLSFLLLIFILFGVIVFTRLLPFVFSRVLKNSLALNALGKYLPAYIMVLLTIFEIKLSAFKTPPYNIPAVIALLIMVAVHWRWRRLILSLVVAVSVYVAADLLISI